ncbi:site-specific DNA-methyltransferase [Weissella confusa]|uniref:DNA methyltransferase n=1 Tax=Weissella confusa TaxID=1583 RepID=UPI0021B06086|nr:DNA methyltransferase [Weissella confusa]MCS9991684.1 site-specific DNA-methyltransferase [Weissella confusa]
MLDSKIMETTKSILKDFGNTYFSDKGTLKRNKVIEDLDAYTPMLMKALLANQLIHDTYTESIVIDDKSVELFKLNQFIEMFTYKEYWQDSYTKFENKIGLTAGGKFIDETADVVLDFPFKDTVLKAGMTKEDQKDADEPFLHETIAKAEIDQLFEPKIFVNATKYDQENVDGEILDSFDDENLIIKGNNLVALHTLKSKYGGRVKTIFIDPPYNTENDSFIYNDNFNESTWLTFMKNRLEIAYDLLSEEGTLFITLDDSEAHYMKILADSIFGKYNFLSDIIWNSTKSVTNTALISVSHTHVLTWFKNKDWWIKHRTEFRLPESGEGFSNPDNDERGPWKADPFQVGGWRPNQQYEIVNPKTGVVYTPNEGSSWKNDYRNFQKLMEEGRIVFGVSGDGAPQRKRFLSEALERGRVTKTIWDDIGTTTNGTSHLKKIFHGKSPFTNPKPEQLIKRILDISTNENDLVLDFFMGSATTQAVAMKMNRRFIGVEQMDYIKTVSVERLKKVIAGEQGGISKDVNWQGGGSFVYAELMEKNQGYLKDVQQAETTKQLEDVVNRMIEGGADFDFRVDVEKVLQDSEYQTMSLADKKQLIVKVIDKNQLYYAYSEMDDHNVQELMSDSDIAFNKSFYEERDL